MFKKLKNIARGLFPWVYLKLGKIKRKVIIRKFIKNYPDTRVFEIGKDGFDKLYSQEGQDYIVFTNFFRDKTDGVFCDIGGNHPSKYNNTRYFEENGWSGYVFEPLPYMKELWEKERKAKLYPYALSDSEGQVTFTVVKDKLGSEDMFSFVKETGELNRDYVMEDILVQTRTLNNVFSEEGVSHIDYMSIDVEGHELNVLKGIDFSKLNIEVLTIENNPSCCQVYGDENIRQIMLNNGYVLWGRIVGLDDIYVKNMFL